MAAGGPAGNTRATFSGAAIARPVASVTAARATDVPTAAKVAAMKARREVAMGRTSQLWKLIYPNHHATCLDDGVSRLSFFEPEVVRRLVGYRGGDDLSANIDANVGSGHALFHLDDFAFELISRAGFHAVYSLSRRKTVLH